MFSDDAYELITFLIEFFNDFFPRAFFSGPITKALTP